MQQINALHVKHNTEKESMKKSIYLYRSELTAIGILLLVVVYILYKRKRKRKQPETKEILLRKSDIYARFHSINHESNSSITEKEWAEFHRNLICLMQKTQSDGTAYLLSDENINKRH